MRIPRLRFLWPALVLAFGISAGLAATPNVVLMMADDLGWGDTGFNGNKIIKTPHLDAMAAEGLKFQRFYAAAPVCSPTRASCLTGRHPYRLGIPFANSGHMKTKELTLAELLKEKKGYATGHFGKWHLGTLTKKVKDANRGGPRGAAHFSLPSQSGFDVYFSTESKVPTWDPMLKPENKKTKTWWDPSDLEKGKAEYGTRYWIGDDKFETGNLSGDDSRVIMDRAVPFMEKAVKDQKPFFAVVWFHAPHLPVVAGPKHAAIYKDRTGYERNYYGCITALDEQVGRLRAKLRELGVANETIVFFCSDNGPEGASGKAPGSAGPFRGRKRSLYEGGVRVPALAVWPGKIKAESMTDFPACTSDYLPTILAAIGEELPGRPLDGIDLGGLFRGKAAMRSKAIGFQSRGQSSWVEHRFKLIRPKGNADYELYDLLSDPAESKNIASEKPDLVRRMRSELEAWQASCKRSEDGADY